ncbi:MAG: hypothetical protein HY298_19970 [Verrucomicrobia bacterium]|nr:hypothetical protein [Verrucomicrobiota bacterium]
MNVREKLQLAYELAFHPARLNEIWNGVEQGTAHDLAALREAADWAAALHQRLPEAPDVSARALKRLAGYQANARLFRMVTAVNRLREVLGNRSAVPPEVPAWMVRDIALPPLGPAGRVTPSRPGEVEFTAQH